MTVRTGLASLPQGGGDPDRSLYGRHLRSTFSSGGGIDKVNKLCPMNGPTHTDRCVLHVPFERITSPRGTNDP